MDSLSGLSKTELVSELIFRLRDQNVSIPDGFGEPTTARNLLELGPDSVPMLIAAMDDSRLTRIVRIDSHSPFWVIPNQITVGQCAHVILACLGAPDLGSPFNANRDIEKIKRDASEWYRGMQEKVEKDVLVDRTMAGDFVAQKLTTGYPDVALSALLLGFANSTNAIERRSFLALITTFDTPEVTALLLSEYENNQDISARRAAADGLLDRRIDIDLAPIIWAWNNSEEASVEWHIGYRFLANTGSVAAIQALGKNLRDMRGDSKKDLITTFCCDLRRHTESSEGAVVQLLSTALDDTEFVPSSRRICDLAANALLERDPNRFSFARMDSLAARERTRIQMKNVFRIESGLAPLPVPAMQTVRPIPSTELNSLLESYVSAEESSLDEIESRIITLGLGALPTVIDRHDAAATKELRSRFARLLRKLNDIVMDVLLSDQSQRISEKAIVLKGKPLDIVKCEQIARAILQENSAAQGIYLNAVRESSGVEIYIELLDTERTRRKIKSRKQVKGSGSNGYDRLSITNRLGETEFNSPQPKSAIRKLLTDSGLMPIETWFSLTLEIYKQPQ